MRRAAAPQLVVQWVAVLLLAMPADAFDNVNAPMPRASQPANGMIDTAAESQRAALRREVLDRPLEESAAWGISNALAIRGLIPEPLASRAWHDPAAARAYPFPPSAELEARLAHGGIVDAALRREFIALLRREYLKVALARKDAEACRPIAQVARVIAATLDGWNGNFAPSYDTPDGWTTQVAFTLRLRRSAASHISRPP